MRGLALVVVAISFLLSCPIIAAEGFRFSGKVKCELSATFIVLNKEQSVRLSDSICLNRKRD